MNTKPQIKRHCRHLSEPTPTAFLPEDLIVEIISWLPVKPLMTMKCVSKSYNTIISDPNFVKLHLNRSSRNTHTYVVAYEDDCKLEDDYCFVPFSVTDLSHMPEEPCHYLIDKDCRKIVGSCNGLVCLLGSSEHQIWFRFWNPATRTISDKLGFLHNDEYHYEMQEWNTFGYDKSTDTYKVVALLPANDWLTTEVRVLSFGDNIWRNIQSFAVTPFQLLLSEFSSEMFSGSELFSGVHLNGTINWLSLVEINRFVIISLDLSTEKYKILCVPHISREELHAFPRICVIMNDLCFYHDVMGTDVLVWRMTKFGDEKSWTKFFLFNHNILTYDPFGNIFRDHCLYFNLYVNGDILALIHNGGVVLYNWRNGKLLKSTYSDQICWLSMNNYVESLVSTR